MNLFYKDRLRRLQSLIRAGIVIFLISFVPTHAASLAEYKIRVEQARAASDEFFENLDAADETYGRQTTAEIQRLLPVTEKVEWPGGSVETDNGWLGPKLTEFTALRDPAKRGAILSEISERLLAISGTIDELEKATASGQSKDQDKQKLAEILRREEYQKPQAAEESLFQKSLREFLEWLAKAFPGTPGVPSVSPGTGSLQFGLQILIYALVIGLIGFLIYKFAPYFFRQFGARVQREKKDRVILGERVGAGESSSDLFDEAERLARDGNLRAAIRKGYIALLCDLSDRKIIRLARHKTNRDYLRDVRKDSVLTENMTGLTRNYEMNWYGLRTTEQADWDDFRERYRLINRGQK